MFSVRDIIPQHIRESNPLFVEYLRGYYEWLKTYGPANDINNHLNRKTLAKSSADYNKYLFDMLLSNVPQNVFTSKEIAIQWSKKIHSTKGSRQSIKFLFKLLYGEDISIFLPKTNMFELSAGKWAYDEKIIYVSVADGTDLSNTNIRYLKQVVSEFGENQRNVVADVQRIQPVYSSKMSLLEIYVKTDDVFDMNQPVYTQDDVELTIIPSTKVVNIIDGGSNYQVGDRIYSTETFSFSKEYECDSTGFIETNINTFLSKYEIKVFRNSTQLANEDFRYQDNILYSDLFEVGDVVEIQYPASQGLFTVKKTDDIGSILEIEILSSALGVSNTFVLSNSDAGGSNAVIEITQDTLREVEDRYLNERGRLSADSYLHDSNYYQNYSYVIQTQQDISAYSDILNNTVHPAGVKFFGQITILTFVKNLISIVDLTIDIKTTINVLHKYGLGPSYKDFDKFKNNADDKFYPISTINDLDLQPMYGSGDVDNKLIILGLLAGPYGVMTSTNIVDCHITMPDDYISVPNDDYWDTEYVSSRD